MQADLNWNQSCEKARMHQNQEKKIFWQLNLGLFQHLTLPLANQTQFNALFLSLEHFRDTIWKEFERDSLGLCFYNGNADFSQDFQWDEDQEKNWLGWLQDRSIPIQKDTHPNNPHMHWLAQLYCRDAAADYLQLLAANLTDTIPLYLALDCSTIADPLQYARLTTGERFEPFHLILQKGILAQPEQATVGICLPSMHLILDCFYEGLAEAIEHLMLNQTTFRIIPEYYLINQWDGLDYLVVVASSINPQARRKLQGFCAAGGTILTLGQPLGLPNEMPFADFRL